MTQHLSDYYPYYTNCTNSIGWTGDYWYNQYYYSPEVYQPLTYPTTFINSSYIDYAQEYLKMSQEHLSVKDSPIPEPKPADLVPAEKTLGNHVLTNHEGIPHFRLKLERDYSVPVEQVTTMNRVVEVLHTMLDHSPIEQMVVLYFNSQLELIGSETIAMGQLESVTAYMREVFRGALLACAPRIIISHNHPSGNATASEADIGYTLAALSAGALMGVEVMDHIVVAPSGQHYSIFQHKERLIEMANQFKQAQEFESLFSKLLPNNLKKMIAPLFDSATLNNPLIK